MRYVILRDDDTNALTPAGCLERLYRPFLKHGLPINLAVIPNVSTAAAFQPGEPEKFLMANNFSDAKHVPIGNNPELVDYIRSQPLFHVVQHGFCHESVGTHREFDHDNQPDIVQRLEEGLEFLDEAGLGRPETFVAPYDRLSTVSLLEVARRFKVLSTGWFEWERLPLQWKPRYLLKRLTGAPHWEVNNVILLSHPGCHLSCHHARHQMLEKIKKSIQSRHLTVLVTHWWEYFRDGKPDKDFIEVLHKTADYLAAADDTQVISFSDVAEHRVALN